MCTYIVHNKTNKTLFCSFQLNESKGKYPKHIFKEFREISTYVTFKDCSLL